jgi:hypothetical protein
LGDLSRAAEKQRIVRWIIVSFENKNIISRRALTNAEKVAKK